MNSNINLYIRRYEYEEYLEYPEEYVLSILLGDKNYKDKDIAFISFSNICLYPNNIVILINYNKYCNYFEENKKKILQEIQTYASTIDSRIPKL